MGHTVWALAGTPPATCSRARPRRSCPHGFLGDPTLQGREQAEVQLTTFLKTGLRVDPDGPGPIFETPIVDPCNLQCLHYPNPQTGQGAYSNGPPAAGECRDQLN